MIVRSFCDSTITQIRFVKSESKLFDEKSETD